MGEKIWKINTTDGKSYLVYSNESNIIKFTKSILPQQIGAEVLSTFKCAEEYIKDDISLYNSVVIIGSKVTSVEYYVA